MMNKNYLSIIALFALITSTQLSAQDKDRKSNLSSRVDSIVNNIFQRFDDQLGTYIFRDEPSMDTERTEASEVQAADETYTTRKEHSRSHAYFGSSLYAFDTERGIVRNVYPPFPWEFIDENILFRYNRVEGLFLGLNYPQKYYWEDRKITLFGSGGYGFKAHRWRGGLGLAQQFGAGESIFEMGLEGHSLTDTHDQWIVGVGENNAAAILFRDDYRDYFGREGFSIWTGIYKRWNKSDLQFQIAFLNDVYESLSRTTNWSVFGGDKLFHENPAINEGKMKSVLATLKFHSLQSRNIFTTGWSFSASAEIADKPLSSDFNFNSYIIDVRRYQPIGDYDNINLRLRAGSATGEVPIQKAFDIGGISTIPAYGFKEFTGNRVLLANIEYVINGKLFDDSEPFPSWLLRNLNLILFADAGYVATEDGGASAFHGFNNINSKTIRSDWGVGVGTRDAKLRLGFAWKTDVAEPVKIFLRLNRPF